ncbi:MAG: hypothetical protein LUC43_05840 [Burkholderiales bacterium]|nr:hypothetical protein [Burkholderiales bacterium]
MKKTKLTASCASAFLIALLTACAAPGTYYDAGLGEADYYGAIPSLPGYTPQVWNPNPIIAIGAGSGLAPIYLNVPAYQRLNWGVYCSIYSACYRPVYFVLSNWYRTIFAPAYLRRYGRPGPAFRPMGQPGGMRPPQNRPPATAKPSPRPSFARPAVKPGSIPGVRPRMQRPTTTGLAAMPVAKPANRPATAKASSNARPSAGGRPPAGARPAPPPKAANASTLRNR